MQPKEPTLYLPIFTKGTTQNDQKNTDGSTEWQGDDSKTAERGTPWKKMKGVLTTTTTVCLGI